MTKKTTTKTEDKPKATRKKDEESTNDNQDAKQSVSTQQTLEKKPLRDTGSAVYVKQKDFSSFKKEMQSETEYFVKQLSSFKKQAKKENEKLSHRVHNLRGLMIIVLLLSISLTIISIWLIISTTNLSSQLSLKKSQQNPGQSIAVNETQHEINLDEKDQDINLTEGGTYTLTGRTNHQVNINSSDTIVLRLAGVDISTETDSAIKSTSTQPVRIELADNTENILKSNGRGDDGGTIHTKGVLSFSGTGTLETYGSQQFGSGITTKQYYSIEQGNVLSLGSDMLEKPMQNLSQNTLCFDLNQTVHAGNTIQIRNQTDQIIYSFKPTQDFRTVIWSSPNLKNGNYRLTSNYKTIAEITI